MTNTKKITKIRLAGISPQSLVNGEGLRTVLFSQGCKHACPECFNPETWSFTGGKWFAIDKIIADIVKQQDYLDGVTLSGGDPIEQYEAFIPIVEAIKAKTKLNIWCYTGYTWEELLKKIKTEPNLLTFLKSIDFLMDGRFVKSKLSSKAKDPKAYPYRGSTNQRLIDVQKSLKNKQTVIKN
ncbi:MAG: anaerobic ribonucleoside-triphosphate reductase activating protein [Mycoplasmataceae bacterium]|nr:anaerobic ribonucleoside-triphosphate reductase activating protein [Mycoplasmataceae bacterium]